MRDKWSEPTPVTDLQIAFPANVLGLMPTREEAEEGLAKLDPDERLKWLEFQGLWFSKGLPVKTQFHMKIKKDGTPIDGQAAFRHLRVIQGSFEPKHEHKVAAVAYLASRWMRAVQYGDSEERRH